MHSFLSRPFLDNTVGDFLWLFLIVILALLLRNILSRLIASLAFMLFKRRLPRVEKKDFVDLLLNPLGVFLCYLIFVAAIDHLRYPGQLNFQIHFLHTDMASVMTGLKLIILTVCFFWVVLRLIDFVTLIVSQRSNISGPSGTQVLFFFRDFIKVVIGLIGLLLIMRYIVGKDWSGKLVGALGIGAAALALAAKETIENLIGSFIILLDKPFHIGDSVKVSGVSGVVEKVGLRSTRIRSDDKTYITIPNKQIVDSIVDDLTLMTQRRVTGILELDAATPSDQILQLLETLQQLFKADAEVIDNYTLNLNTISQQAFVIQVIYYTPVTEWQAFNSLKQRINLGIIQSIEKSNVKLAKRFELSTS